MHEATWEGGDGEEVDILRPKEKPDGTWAIAGRGGRTGGKAARVRVTGQRAVRRGGAGRGEEKWKEEQEKRGRQGKRCTRRPLMWQKGEMPRTVAACVAQD